MNGTTSHNLSTTSLPHTIITTTIKLTATQEEHHISLTFFFILMVIGICILIIHLLITTKIHYLPESVAIVLVGALIGFILKMVGNWRQQEEFPPMVFFLVFLPPIIFESGYNLHKGNFFQNIGSILVFAIIGTTISAVVIGGGLYLCGIANLAYQLSIFESFGFGSLISAVDPVATLAIFKAMDVDPILYMLVFGESILNDAVSIVLMTTIMSLDRPENRNKPPLQLLGKAIGGFLVTFLASAAIGTAFALVSALVLKFLDLRKTPSLEVGMMLVFCYAPYCLCEAIGLSGIMAILFAGIVMSHYTHRNLSPVSQMTVQQIFRALAFIAETVVFAYLGMAIFSFRHRVEPALIGWVIVLILLGRAFNIFPLSFLLNYFRDIQITLRNQVVLWFSGLRGAIAFALALHLEGVSEDTQQVLVTTALIVVLFTIIFLGGLTLPFMKLITWVTSCIGPTPLSSPSLSSSSSDDDDTMTGKYKGLDDDDDDEAGRSGFSSSTSRSRRNKTIGSNGDIALKPLLSDSSSVPATPNSYRLRKRLLRQRYTQTRHEKERMYRSKHRANTKMSSNIDDDMSDDALFSEAAGLSKANMPHQWFISKTKEMGQAADSDNNNMSGYYDTEAEAYNYQRRITDNRRKIRGSSKRLRRSNSAGAASVCSTNSGTPHSTSSTPVNSITTATNTLRGFIKLDVKYLFPFFTRAHTEQDVRDAHKSMSNISEQWSRIVRTVPSFKNPQLPKSSMSSTAATATNNNSTTITALSHTSGLQSDTNNKATSLPKTSGSHPDFTKIHMDGSGSNSKSDF